MYKTIGKRVNRYETKDIARYFSESKKKKKRRRRKSSSQNLTLKGTTHKPQKRKCRRKVILIKKGALVKNHRLDVKETDSAMYHIKSSDGK